MLSKRVFFSCLLAGAMALAGASCSKKTAGENDPKQRLVDYIAQSFKVTDVRDREKLTAYLTGGAKNRLIAWSDEQFREAFIETKRQFIKLAIREVKSPSDAESNITYELTYTDQSKGVDARVTHKRMCELVLENGKWFIREVHNIKELIEYKNEMSLQVGKF